jgi:hypothetical protein
LKASVKSYIAYIYKKIIMILWILLFILSFLLVLTNFFNVLSLYMLYNEIINTITFQGVRNESKAIYKNEK